MTSFVPQNFPLVQHPEVFGLHENVDISKDLQQTKLLFDSIIQAQGGSRQGTSGNTDSTLNDICADILVKVCESELLVCLYTSLPPS